MTRQVNPTRDYRERLIDVAQSSDWFMSALKAVRELGLSSWCIGAGAVRNLVWDALHELPAPSALNDIDVAYFDPSDASQTRDAALRERLCAIRPNLPWEVTNQAGVHLWFEGYFGHAVPPLRSLEDAVASWPEYVTSVGVTLREDNKLEIISPHGLDDLFAMIVRRNPARVSVETYRERVAQKRYMERWPHVTVLTE